MLALFGWAEESGQTLVEYALILSFVAIALVASLLLFQIGLQDVYQNIIDTVEGLI